MKELSVEEKARRYDEILARATGAYLPYYTEDIMTKVREFVEYLIPELTESDDERIRKTLIRFHKSTIDVDGIKGEDIISWLEKQGEHANFRNKIQIGDKVTRNRDGMLVNLSQLNRVAKKDENQEYQKPADKVEPKFKVGNKIYLKPEYRMPNDDTPIANTVFEIRAIDDKHYRFDSSYIFIEDQDKYELVEQKPAWTIEDAKAGDVLAAHECLVLFKEIDGLNIRCYCTYHFLNNRMFFVDTLQNKAVYKPATKEQRDELFKAIKENGYMWDLDKLELKKF